MFLGEFKGQLMKDSANYPLLFFMVDVTDGFTPETGLTPTVTISKNGAAYASPAGAVTELGNGWYQVAGNATDLNTLGTLRLRATDAAARTVNIIYMIGNWELRSTISSLVWDTLTAALTVANTIGKKLADLGVGTDARVKISADAHTAGAAVASVTAGVTVATNSDKTGYAISASGLTAIENQIWNALVASHATASTFGKVLQDGAADPLAKAVPGAYSAGTLGKVVGDNLNATVSSRSSLAAADILAQVNAALDTAGSELSAVPSTTGTLRQKINFIFQYFRNKRTMTATTETAFKEDGSTSLGTASISNDGTTATKGEMN